MSKYGWRFVLSVDLPDDAITLQYSPTAPPLFPNPLLIFQRAASEGLKRVIKGVLQSRWTPLINACKLSERYCCYLSADRHRMFISLLFFVTFSTTNVKSISEYVCLACLLKFHTVTDDGEGIVNRKIPEKKGDPTLWPCQ